MKKTDSVRTLDLVQACCRALDSKQAVDLRVLDVSKQSTITDYLVVATGNSEPHLRALRIEVEKVLDAAGTHIVGMEMVQESGWMVIDAFDLMVHMFTVEQRVKFGLENLWKDAAVVSVPQLLAVQEQKSQRPKTVRRTTAKKKTTGAKTAKTPAVKKPASRKKTTGK